VEWTPSRRDLTEPEKRTTGTTVLWTCGCDYFAESQSQRVAFTGLDIVGFGLNS
jgi:hypothetical protein